MKSYLVIKDKIKKLNVYYVINQGEYMNNYTNDFQSQKNKFDRNDSYKNIETLKFKLKEFCDTIYQFSDFEIEEIKRIQSIINNRVKHNDDSAGSIYLDENYILDDCLKYAVDDDFFQKYLHEKEVNYKLNQALNFEIKSLILQKKKAISNYDVANAVKISDKITGVSIKIQEQKNKINDIKNDVLNRETEFYNKYLILLQDISNYISTKKAKKIDPKTYDNNINVYFILQKLLFFIKKNYEKNIDDVIHVLNSDTNFKGILGEVFDDVLYELTYVGTNS